MGRVKMISQLLFLLRSNDLLSLLIAANSDYPELQAGGRQQTSRAAADISPPTATNWEMLNGVEVARAGICVIAALELHQHN